MPGFRILRMNAPFLNLVQRGHTGPETNREGRESETQPREMGSHFTRGEF